MKHNGTLIAWIIPLVFAAAALGAEPAAEQGKSATAFASAYVVEADALNLREKPTAASPVVAVLKKGARVQLLSAEMVEDSDLGFWRRVRAGDKEGWVAARYIVPAATSYGGGDERVLAPLAAPGWAITAFPPPPGWDPDSPAYFNTRDNKPKLVVDVHGRLHAIYPSGDKLIYALRDGDRWTATTVDVLDYERARKEYEEGASVDPWFHDWRLAVDGSGRPHGAYIRSYFRAPWDYYPSELRYAYQVNGTWQCETVYDSADIANPSLALDGGGGLHLSFSRDVSEADGTESILAYASREAGRWVVTTVDDGTDGVGHFMGSVIAVDSRGYPHTIYYQGGSFVSLKYASWDGGAWRRETIDPVIKAEGITLALDAAGTPHIAYYDRLGYDLRYAVRKGGEWTRTTVDAADNAGMDVGSASGAGGDLYLGYQRETVGPGEGAKPYLHSLVLARRRSEGWEYRELLTNLHYKWGGLTLDAAGNPRLYGYVGDKWFYAEPTGGEWAPRPPRQPRAAFTYSSILKTASLSPSTRLLLDASAPWRLPAMSGEKLYVDEPETEATRGWTWRWNEPAGEMAPGEFDVVDGRATPDVIGDTEAKRGYTIHLKGRQGDLTGWLEGDYFNPSYSVIGETPELLIYFHKPYEPLRRGPGENYEAIEAPERTTGEPSLGPAIPAGTCYDVVARVGAWIAAGTWSAAWLPLATPGLEPYALALEARYPDRRQYDVNDEWRRGDDASTYVHIAIYLPASGDVGRVIYIAQTGHEIQRPFEDPAITIHYTDGREETLTPRLLSGWSGGFVSYEARFEAPLAAPAPRDTVKAITFAAGWGADRLQATMDVTDVLKTNAIP